MKKVFITCLALGAMLLAGGCACARGGNDPTSSSTTSGQPTINPDMNVTVRFYVDYNAITVSDIYATQTVKNFEKITKPANPTVPPQDEFPNFMGWSTHEVVDDMKYLWDFDKDTVQSRSAVLNLFGVWVEEPTKNVDFKITNCPDWTNKDGVKVFAWTWGNTGEGNGGIWRLCTLNPADYSAGASVTVTINAPEDITGMLLVRCHKDTIQPDWDLQDESTLNTPGRVYNQTDDIAVSAGKTSYECPGWVDYPKKYD